MSKSFSEVICDEHELQRQDKIYDEHELQRQRSVMSKGFSETRAVMSKGFSEIRSVMRYLTITKTRPELISTSTDFVK